MIRIRSAGQRSAYSIIRREFLKIYFATDTRFDERRETEPSSELFPASRDCKASMSFYFERVLYVVFPFVKNFSLLEY